MHVWNKVKIQPNKDQKTKKEEHWEKNMIVEMKNSIAEGECKVEEISQEKKQKAKKIKIGEKIFYSAF